MSARTQFPQIGIIRFIDGVGRLWAEVLNRRRW